MSAVNNPRRFLLSIHSGNKEWPWPSDYYFLGNCVFRECNEVVELMERHTTKDEALLNYAEEPESVIPEWNNAYKLNSENYLKQLRYLIKRSIKSE